MTQGCIQTSAYVTNFAVLVAHLSSFDQQAPRRSFGIGVRCSARDRIVTLYFNLFWWPEARKLGRTLRPYVCYGSIPLKNSVRRLTPTVVVAQCPQGSRRVTKLTTLAMLFGSKLLSPTTVQP